jgi:NhaP-type Na+/H+ or K+/H+ antiporter
MQRRKFFQNIGAICVYAFVGTTMSAAIIGLVVWGSGLPATAPLDGAADGTGFTLHEALIFGSLISATDPVTVLAVFGSARADRDLNALVFGESVLNDAVAIVLYETLDRFNPAHCGVHAAKASPEACDVSISTVVGAFGTGTRILVGSIAVGGALAFASAYLLKRLALFAHITTTTDSDDRSEVTTEFFATEMVVVIVFPYLAWMIAEAFHLSGIVAILFCGIIMAHYTTHNLHATTLAFSRKFFKIVAFGCETFVFVYMGLALFCFRQDFGHPAVVAVALLGMLLARALNVYPLTAVINYHRRPERRISMGLQNIMWFAGLRGAIAFAVSNFFPVSTGYRASASHVCVRACACACVCVCLCVCSWHSRRERATPFVVTP